MVANAIESDDKSKEATKSEETKSEPRSEYRIGKRVKLPSRKEAKEAAKRAGHGEEPIHHSNGNKKGHFHPNVPPPKGQMTPKQPYIHDHYMYSLITMPRIPMEGVVDEKRRSIWTINWGI